MNKKNNNNILYGIIAFLVIILIAGASYFLGQNTAKKEITKIENNTPIVAEAGRLGIDTDKLNKCISENKFLDKINSQMKLGADTFGITGTPGNVLINNKTGEYVVISGAYPKEAFIENIDKLLSDNVENKEEVEKEAKSTKTFKENKDKNTLVIISDKRDSSVSVEQLLASLKQIPEIGKMKVEEYDFSDKGVEEFLEKNNIKALPVILFTTDKVSDKINSYLAKINDNTYSLNIGAKFNPFAKMSSKGFKIVDKEILKKIKENSYISGNKDAKITWLEYSDLECPFCQKLHNSDVKTALQAKYGKDLNKIFNHFPLGFHKKAIPGANILECVGELGGSEDFYKILEYAYKNKIQE